LIDPDVQAKAGPQIFLPLTTDTRALTIFVIDTSLPGGNLRIEAVRGAIGETLPRERVSVISCFEDTAEVVLEPTSSVAYANRRMSRIHRSVMGNLGIGLSKAVEMLQTEFERGTMKITLAIIADSTAHGLVTGTLNCLEESEIMCNIDLFDSANAVSMAKAKADEGKQQLRVVVVDTEAQPASEGSVGGEQGSSSASYGWHEEGNRLATVSRANYFHYPDLSPSLLCR
jgi:Mg-chelatase subunit ChlD